ncbi:MAG: nucleotide exchange factor GrpE [Candidatus Margulisiibacteriota bacterium]|nr:MAG: nucleotide exchange factor GrpE [Candidatus Margulisbacteria bacterium GWD2_39_127]OGI02094.1 MAG: nucleotide exchange factor GrpE [Candidatus Margulisbacteria bacterium GWF2_38_17]OGI10471.1 MAG: nucleotide exchange factor GrpE [Candidatus Margulisbacteria bacterium GWE2_39_32]PZM79983.1 MAG: nucleotide exchange factor GrpE [Candidatus Margulisiibacteriota bacterium]HAR62450.1 nucleotide exchange factor GrpE [Candidatus Margulisiibacteriota bacterium]
MNPTGENNQENENTSESNEKEKVIIHENPGENVAMTSEPELKEKPEEVNKIIEEMPELTKEKEVEEKNKVIEEQKDKYLRLLAEFDNFKKRKEEEKINLLKSANEKLLKEFLTVLDSFDQAFLNIDEKTKNESVTKGLELIHKQVENFITKHHIEPIEAVGTKFDPHVHNAVMEEDSDKYEPGVVTKELQKGYLFHGKVLRPTMAIVSKEK